MFSRIGGLSFGSIKTSWLTDSPGKWCLGIKGFRGSSWGLPISTMGQSTADPTGVRIPQPTPGGPDLPRPACLRRAGLPGLLLALVAELRGSPYAQAYSSSRPPSLTALWTLPQHHSRPDTPPAPAQPLCPGQDWEWAVPWPSCWWRALSPGPVWGVEKSELPGDGVEKPCCPSQARMGPRGLAMCLPHLSLSEGCPQRDRAKACPLCQSWTHLFS